MSFECIGGERKNECHLGGGTPKLKEPCPMGGHGSFTLFRNGSLPSQLRCKIIYSRSRQQMLRSARIHSTRFFPDNRQDLSHASAVRQEAVLHP